MDTKKRDYNAYDKARNKRRRELLGPEAAEKSARISSYYDNTKLWGTKHLEFEKRARKEEKMLADAQLFSDRFDLNKEIRKIEETENEDTDNTGRF